MFPRSTVDRQSRSGFLAGLRQGLRWRSQPHLPDRHRRSPALYGPSQPWGRHQFVRRSDDRVLTERLHGDRALHFLYAPGRAPSGMLLRALGSPRISQILAHLALDSALVARLFRYRWFLNACGLDLTECVDPPDTLDTPRKFFERKIRYWACRPLPEEPDAVVSPADARVVVGSLAAGTPLFLKGKFFNFEELLACNKTSWLAAFEHGDFAIFRLTPEQYHYNHLPVSGVVLDIYEIPGTCHACNPGAVVQLATPYSKNKRVVTNIQTDVCGGSHVGLVALIEVVALMIGEVVQRYSELRYDAPRPLQPGMFVRKGQPKSMYRPGSSTDVVLFQKGKVRFASDLVRNLSRSGADSRIYRGFGAAQVETEVRVRSMIAVPALRRKESS